MYSLRRETEVSKLAGKAGERLFPLAEGVRKALDEGSIFAACCPHPPLRGTLSRRERDGPKTGLSIFANRLEPVLDMDSRRTVFRNLDTSALRNRGITARAGMSARGVGLGESVSTVRDGKPAARLYGCFDPVA